MDGNRLVRSLRLAGSGQRITDDRVQDRTDLLARWQKENRKIPVPTIPKAVDLPAVPARNPAYYDRLVAGGNR